MVLVHEHEHETANVFLLNGFHKQAAQRHHALRVAFSRVNAFFASPPQAFHRLPDGRALQHRAAGRRQGLSDFGQRSVGLRAQAGQQALVARRVQARSGAGMTGQLSH